LPQHSLQKKGWFQNTRNYTKQSSNPLILDTFEQRERTLLAAYDTDSKRNASRHGVVELNGTRVADFQENLGSLTSSLVSIACYAFLAEDARFTEYLNDDNNPDEPGWFIKWLQERRPVHAFTFDGAWFDIGTPEGYLDAVSWALDDNTVVASDATVENSELGENVYVMNGATVTDSALERSIIFSEATVEQSDLRDSIVDRQAMVHDIDLTGALIGAHSQLP
jgi:glucose-1-phosphate thymidylyltransferase